MKHSTGRRKADAFPDGVDPRFRTKSTCGFTSPTLCWYCKRSTPVSNGVAECSWCRNYTPVEGWTATRVHRKDPSYTYGCAERILESYHVHECPLYIPEKAGNEKEEQ